MGYVSRTTVSMITIGCSANQSEPKWQSDCSQLLKVDQMDTQHRWFLRSTVVCIKHSPATIWTTQMLLHSCTRLRCFCLFCTFQSSSSWNLVETIRGVSDNPKTSALAQTATSGGRKTRGVRGRGRGGLLMHDLNACAGKM